MTTAWFSLRGHHLRMSGLSFGRRDATMSYAQFLKRWVGNARRGCQISRLWQVFLRRGLVRRNRSNSRHRWLMRMNRSGGVSPRPANVNPRTSPLGPRNVVLRVGKTIALSPYRCVQLRAPKPGIQPFRIDGGYSDPEKSGGASVPLLAGNGAVNSLMSRCSARSSVSKSALPPSMPPSCRSRKRISAS
jgi:hypothetical protein